MAVGNASYIGSVEDKEERAENRSLWDSEQYVVYPGSL